MQQMGKILVTGGAGFIGSSLVGALLSRRNKVTVLDNFSTGIFQDIKPFENDPNFEFKKGDVLDIKILEESVNNSDIIFHLSANPEVRIGVSNTSIDFEQNVTATYNLLNAMKKSPHCKKVIFTSSSTVYGAAVQRPTDERYSPLSPISLYGASKLACEALISGFCHMFDMSGIVIRLANIVGPHSRHGVIHDFLQKLKLDPSTLEILGDGRQTKSYLYIDDCIEALIHLMHIPNNFDIFNIGSEDHITVSEIADIIFKELKLGNVKTKFIGGVGGVGWRGDVKLMLLDSSKAKKWGWTPKYNSAEAISLTVRGMSKKNKESS